MRSESVCESRALDLSDESRPPRPSETGEILRVNGKIRWTQTDGSSGPEREKG